MTMYDKAIVASGHKLVSQTAAEIMAEGGNAFDAAVAAGFASAVVEPALNSLGGGGFLLGWSAKQGQELFFDFFVDTPGLGGSSDFSPHFFPVTVSFPGTDQDFNVGLGSVAVPGTLKGLLHIHERLGFMDLKDVLHPARELAKGHVLNEQQATFLNLLKPIMTMTPAGSRMYEPDGVYLASGSIIENTDCVHFIELVMEDRGESFYRGDIAREIENEMRQGKGFLTATDLANYKVIERKPLKINYHGYQLFTSPEPSLGGVLIGLSIGLRERLGSMEGIWGSPEYLKQTVVLMKEVERIRQDGLAHPGQLERFLNDPHRCKQVTDSIRLFSRGTTHISISDRDGNCASMTCSNGEGSGYIAPGTGVMLNNMMGEDDLHPDGFHTSPPGRRVGSMMSPSLLVRDGVVRLVIGSGGSKRIRTAISQVLNQIVEYKHDIHRAVLAPRLYWDGECVQVEPGFDSESIADLRESVEVNLWENKDVYFGGVHAVVPGEDGAGDPRRGGSAIII